jgi:ABC-2 type transport system ATP-binding protein
MIQIDGLSKSFRGVQVLDGVSLELGTGEHAALIGANGAGKTTLLRCLLGEYRCEGTLRIDGLVPRESRAEVLSAVGFVPQLPPPLRMPVGELLTFAAQLCRSDRAAMEEVAQRLGLDIAPLRRRAFSKLSGGQKQKLLIAVALGRSTRLLVMDEPAANLDPEARATFFELLAERSEQTTMLLSSHRLDEVAALVQRVVELDKGKVVLDDRVAETGALDARLHCSLRLASPEPAVARSLEAWGFHSADGGCSFEGQVAGPDRLRFFAMLSRYSGLIEELSLSPDDAGRA